MSEKSESYSLSNLEEWLEDAINSDTTPQEVYDSIVESVKKNMRYHKACYDSSVKLLGLLRGKKNISISDGITTELMEGITVESSNNVFELPTDYYNTSMFDLTSPVLEDLTGKETE